LEAGLAGYFPILFGTIVACDIANFFK
jgi:hypothetical protein